MSDAPSTHDCPECGGFIDNYAPNNEEFLGKVAIGVTQCLDCGFERATAAWGGVDAYEAWGTTRILAAPYEDAPDDAVLLKTYHDRPTDGEWVADPDEDILAALREHDPNEYDGDTETPSSTAVRVNNAPFEVHDSTLAVDYPEQNSALASGPTLTVRLSTPSADELRAALTRDNVIVEVSKGAETVACRDITPADPDHLLSNEVEFTTDTFRFPPPKSNS